MLISPSAGPYTYILLLIPLALILGQPLSRWERMFLIASWVLLGAILSVPISRFFPKVWMLLAVFFVVGRRYWPFVSRKSGFAIVMAAAAVSLTAATLRYNSYEREPARRWQRIAVKEGSGFEESPAILRSGIVFQTIVKNRYGLRWVHQGHMTEFVFSGQALRPVAVSPEGPVRFELLTHRVAINMLLDPTTGRSWKDENQSPINQSNELISPDGKWIASCHREGVFDRVWLRVSAGGPEIRLTDGYCASWSPAWDLDSRG